MTTATLAPTAPSTRVVRDLSFPIKALYIVLPILFFAGFVGLRHSARPDYYQLVREDGPVEATQALLFAAAGVVSFLIARRLFKLPSQRLTALAFAGLALGLGFIAGEEISWGQRLIGFQTPPEIAEANIQKEFTVHNLKALGNVVHKVFIAIGLYAVFGKALCWLLARRAVRGPLGLILVDWHVAPFFAPFLGIYVVYEYLNVYIEPHYGFPLVLWQDLETAEFFLSSGFLAFALSKFFQLRASASQRS